MIMLQRLCTSVETLGALGAELRLRQEGKPADPQIAALLGNVVRALDAQLLDGLDGNARAAALARIQSGLRQAVDLLDNPSRAPGWSFQDPIILQSQGQLSRLDRAQHR